MGELFLVIVYLGSVGGAAGPLPYDMDECQSRAAEMTEKAEKAWADPEIAAKLRAADPKQHPGGTRFLCRKLSARPEIGAPWVDAPGARP